MIRVLFISAFMFSTALLSGQTTPEESPAAKSMDDALSEMSKMMDTMDISSLMKGLDMDKIIGSSDFESMFEMMDSLDLNQLFGGSQGLEGLGMGDKDLEEMMKESMKMLEGVDMDELMKMMEGVDMNEMMKMLEGVDMSEMMKMFEGINPEDLNLVPPTSPTENSKKKKMKKL